MLDPRWLTGMRRARMRSSPWRDHIATVLVWRYRALVPSLAVHNALSPWSMSSISTVPTDLAAIACTTGRLPDQALGAAMAGPGPRELLPHSAVASQLTGLAWLAFTAGLPARSWRCGA